MLNNRKSTNHIKFAQHSVVNNSENTEQEIYQLYINFNFLFTNNAMSHM